MTGRRGWWSVSRFEEDEGEESIFGFGFRELFSDLVSDFLVWRYGRELICVRE